MSTKNMLRWSGFSLILAGVLVVLATVIHPSKETPQTILAQETRLITGHWLFTFYSGFLFLGLPGVYASQARQLGRLGLAGYLSLIFGNLLYVVSSDYGFNAPVLARGAPDMLDAINRYPPVIIMDGLFVVLLLIGFAAFGIAVVRTRVFPPWTGILIAVGWPLYMVGAALSLQVLEALWVVVIFAAVLTGAGLAGIGYALWSGK
jgi:hypothetical protein